MSFRHPFRRPIATVAINMRPVKGPWGGSSVFVTQFEALMRWRGYEVRYDLKADVDVILLIDPRRDLMSKAFGMDEILRYRQAHPRVRVLHRVNECSQRNNSPVMDQLLAEANRVADHTVFISDYHDS